MRYSLILPALLVCTLIAGSCHKATESISGGGKGGNKILRIYNDAHEVQIDTLTAYIKYGVQDIPANGIYDDSASVIIVNSRPVIIFSGLTKGLYYIYGSGYHTGYGTVTGGVKTTIKDGDDTADVLLQL